VKISAFGNHVIERTSRYLPVAAMPFIAGTAWADTVANGGRNFVTTYDVALMLLSGIGLMIFVARRRRKDGRDDE